MRCEMCTKRLGSKEIAHGIRYGVADPISDLFKPSRESAYTVICQTCAERLLREIYSRLNKPTYAAPYYR